MMRTSSLKRMFTTGLLILMTTAPLFAATSGQSQDSFQGLTFTSEEGKIIGNGTLLSRPPGFYQLVADIGPAAFDMVECLIKRKGQGRVFECCDGGYCLDIHLYDSGFDLTCPNGTVISGTVVAFPVGTL